MNRTIETCTIKGVTDGSVSYTNGMGHGMFPEMEGKVKAGDVVDIEMKGTLITGAKHHRSDAWMFHKTDEDLEREHLEIIERFRQQRVDRLAASREDWTARTNALPDWIRGRILRFMETGGENFEVEGWGYELCIAELAVLYAKLLDAGKTFPVSYADESVEIHEYADKNGTSGNQHNFASALAMMHHNGEDVGYTASGLSPLNGDRDYSGKVG